MKKNKAGERKRTVTITFGEKSWAMLAALQEVHRISTGGVVLSITAVAACALADGITRQAKLFNQKDLRTQAVCYE